MTTLSLDLDKTFFLNIFTPGALFIMCFSFPNSSTCRYPTNLSNELNAIHDVFLVLLASEALLQRSINLYLSHNLAL